MGNTQAPVINVFLFALLSPGVLRACEDTVAGWGGQGVLREIQRVPAYRLCTIVSKSPPVQAHGVIILSLSKFVLLCVKRIYRCISDIIYTDTCDQLRHNSIFSDISGLVDCLHYKTLPWPDFTGSVYISVKLILLSIQLMYSHCGEMGFGSSVTSSGSLGIRLQASGPLGNIRDLTWAFMCPSKGY